MFFLFLTTVAVVAVAIDPNSLSWENTQQPSMSHPYHLSHHIDMASSTVFFKVFAQTAGYVALGITEAGGMRGSDIMVASVDDDTGELTVGDYFALDESMPEADCSQDWVGHFGQQTMVDGEPWTEVIVSRLFDTGDLQDRVIANDGDATRFIAAYSPYDMDNLSYHGTSRHYFNVNIFNTGSSDTDSPTESALLAALKARTDVFSFTTAPDNFPIPNVKTTYESFEFNMPETIEGANIYIVGFEPALEPGNERFIHHFTLYGCETENKNTCNQQNLIWGWASGVVGSVFPPGTGIKLGDGGYKTFIMQTHFDNAAYESGIFDNSGTIFYYTYEPVEQEIGIFQIADGRQRNNNQPIIDGLSQSHFECPSSCTNGWVAGDEYTVMDVQVSDER